mmetsp:Transcript_5909/g.10287  ORF Transcript_5909/g.10287 Transcript_5909/m.10287 type:complete len:248 (+) Transcript_5909:185-928(+)|eukprot:CAMPEP_0119105228 /NCGR_PEP_ID=MMETSP1180-20130426/3256_1 /TAXON_ID=3052 ORGANISM="Chlamydomonas cf sp, Strain CCMP681" /NCGR_SAMPLE_ID=MMETSP1180 /ASSEMBLY_ACC=CAM_ASM_000741 /LENGTH=247 /DNA_ID=CAMNT_0007090233 /DNA_START=180 /DNA_END=923 /DNA_ORIENTATION=-
MATLTDVTEAELQGLYTWVDEIPLSRPKRNIARDFSDGVLMAELVHHYFPKLIELHNYSSANGTTQKMYNWKTLNQKVFKRLGFTIPKADCEAVSNCLPGAVERTLKLVQMRLIKARDEGFTGVAAPVMVPAASIASVGAAAVVHAYRPEMQPQHVPSSMPYSTVNIVAQPAPMYRGPGLGISGPKVMMGGGAIPQEVLMEKDQTIGELRETNEILETKVRKLEQLVRLKDAKLSTLMAKLQSAGLA